MYVHVYLLAQCARGHADMMNSLISCSHVGSYAFAFHVFHVWLELFDLLYCARMKGSFTCRWYNRTTGLNSGR